MNFDENNTKPVETGNSKIINEITSSILPLTLLRYESIAEFYTEEPMQIFVKLSENDEVTVLEQVFRLRMWITNTKIFSWSIYCNEREFSNTDSSGLVLRHAVWDRWFDTKRMKEASKTDNEKLLNSWPSIKLRNIYFSRHNITSLSKLVSKVDSLVSNGIVLKKRKADSSQPVWKDLEIMRRYDWGQVHSTWSPFMENHTIEKNLFSLCEEFEKQINLGNDSIYKMSLDYNYPTNDYKSLICKGSY